MKGWWFENCMSQLRVCFSEEGAKNLSCPWLSPLRVLGSLTVTFTGKLVYMLHYFILLLLNALGLRVDREGWWYDLPMSQLWVSLSAQGAKNISWHWLSELQELGSLTLTLTGKCVYMDHHFILLQLNPFGIRVDKERWLFQYYMSQFQVCLPAEGAKKVSWLWLTPL